MGQRNSSEHRRQGHGSSSQSQGTSARRRIGRKKRAALLFFRRRRSPGAPEGEENWQGPPGQRGDVDGPLELSGESAPVPVVRTQVSLCPASPCLRRTENVNVEGDKNTCFFGPVSGIFNVTASPKITESRRPDASLAQKAADSCEEALKKWYTTTGCYVQMIPWVDDDTKHIMDIYTSLQLVCEDNTAGRLPSYQDIFGVLTREGNPVRRIILDGMAGVGKSTLVCKMAYDWAQGRGQVLQKYKLVLALKMHALRPESGLIEAVFEQLLERDTAIDRTDLKWFLDTNPDKVLILLDSFDEFASCELQEDSFGSVLKVLSRREGRDCSVVVTTRSSHLSCLVSKSLVQRPYTHVKVLGFTEEEIKKYVSKFFLGEAGKAKDLFERIQTSDVLLDLGKSPMLLLLMCVLWREDSTLPDTMSHLYRKALQYIFKRKSDLTCTPREMSQVFIQTGRVALHGLFSPTQQVSFEETDFEAGILSTALKVGLLTRQRVLKGLQIQNKIQFMHVTCQEFCAARCFRHLMEADPKEFQKVLGLIKRDLLHHPARLTYLLRFCCGDNELCSENKLWASKILEVLQQHNPFSDAISKLALVCFFESQLKIAPSMDFVRSMLMQHITIEEYNSDCLNSFVWCLNVARDSGVDTGTPVLADVQGLDMRRCNLQRFASGLARPVSEMRGLSVLVLRECSLNSDSMECIAAALGNLPKLTELDLSGNRDLGGTVSAWAPLLHSLKHLRRLTAEDCHLNSRDLRDLARSVGHMGQLEFLCTDLRNPSPKEDFVWDTSPLVTPLDEEAERSGLGVKLNLTDCSFGGTEVAEFMEAMAQRSDLVVLDLSLNTGLADSSSQWFCALKHLKQLRLLLLRDCSLLVCDVEHLAIALADMPSLADVDLSLNNLGGLASAWAPHLQSMQHLQTLTLRSCSLTGEDVRQAANSLAAVPTLTGLDLSSNEALGGSGATWAPHMQQLRSLQSLSLRKCALTSDDIKHVCLALRGVPACVDLNLASNEQLGGVGRAWCHRLVRLQHLRRLGLLGCNLTKQDLKYLVATVGSMPHLTDCSVRSPYQSGRFALEPTRTGVRLDLSLRSLTGKDLADILQALRHRSDLVEFVLGSSDALSGSAVLWSPHLKKLRNLERMEICNCSLQRDDIEHISATLSDMSSLTKLGLSQNDTLGGSGKAWSPHLRQMSHLQTLDLSECALTGIDMKHIAVSLKAISTLMELNLKGNDSLAGTLSLWHSDLQSLTNLITLTLDDCNFRRQDFRYIAESIGQMDRLLNCSIRSSYSRGRSMFQVKPNPSGLQVTLCDRSLTGADLAGILEALGNRADVTELSVVGVDSLKPAAAWAPGLMRLQHLQTLVLQRCSLQEADISPIAESLSAVPSLVELDLSDNITLGEQGHAWAPHLQQVSHLQKLYLRSCALTREDVTCIGVAYKGSQALSMLDLSNNKELSHCATAWVQKLKDIMGLRTLSMAESTLTSEDNRCIDSVLTNTVLVDSTLLCTRHGSNAMADIKP